MRERLPVSPSRRSQAGVTLIELMVSVALIGIVLAGVMGAFLSQNRLYRSQREGAEAAESARLAMSVIERYLSRAGYGMSPGLAFDFNWYECDSTGGGCCDADDGPCTRDGASSGSDQLVFYSRRLEYFALEDPKAGLPTFRGAAWQAGAGTSSGGVDLIGNGDATSLRQGQVLLVEYRDAYGVNPYTYVTVKTNTDVAAAGTTTVVPETAQADVDAFRQNAALDNHSFATGSARVFLVDRYRFLVRNDPVSNRPFLYLDRGTDLNGDGTIDVNDLVPVAPDVEDLQVAYLMADGTVYGNTGTPGETSQPAPQAGDGQVEQDLLFKTPCDSILSIPYYRDRAITACGTGDPNRRTRSPGNIASVRVSIVARSPTPVRTDQGALLLTDPPSRFGLENHDRSAESASDGYVRYRLTTTIRIPNMEARGIPFI